MAGIKEMRRQLSRCRMISPEREHVMRPYFGSNARERPCRRSRTAGRLPRSCRRFTKAER